jgi:hypothetical protein
MTCTRCSKLIIEPICFECGRKKPWVAGPRAWAALPRLQRRSAPPEAGAGVAVAPPKGPKPLAGGAAAKRERLDS